MWKNRKFSDDMAYEETGDERGAALKMKKPAVDLVCEFLTEKRLRPDQVQINTCVSKYTTIIVWWVED